MSGDSQTAKEKKDRGGWGPGIKELSDSDGKEVERREACRGYRLMAHRAQCVGEN